MIPCAPQGALLGEASPDQPLVRGFSDTEQLGSALGLSEGRRIVPKPISSTLCCFLPEDGAFLELILHPVSLCQEVLPLVEG